MTKERFYKPFKKKLVKALRSGEYQQGIEDLYDPTTGSYCCLGVACVIAGVSEEVIEYSPLPDDEEVSRMGVFNYKADQSEIPAIPQSKHHSPSSWRNASAITKLAALNDSGKSFNYIASYIERYL